MVSTEIDSRVSIQQYRNLNFSFCSSLVLNCKRVLPSFCRCMCCRETTRDRMFNKSFNKYRNEIEITRLIKTIRLLKGFAKKKVTRL